MIGEINEMGRFKTHFYNLKQTAKGLKKEIRVLYLAYKHPDVPWYAKVFVTIVIAYALSPIDLIPDFVPILGYLDDLILIPLGITIAIKLIPKNILDECRIQADKVFKEGKPKNWIVGTIIILIWVSVLSLALYKLIVFIR